MTARRRTAGRHRRSRRRSGRHAILGLILAAATALVLPVAGTIQPPDSPGADLRAAAAPAATSSTPADRNPSAAGTARTANPAAPSTSAAASPDRARPGRSTCSTVPQRFGRMFSGLPAARWSRAAVDSLSAATMVDADEEVAPEGEIDEEENPDIDAGHTYAGQLIDHDLTNEQITDLDGTVDPATVVNARTPRFDLDSIYGNGLARSPQLYDADRVHLKVGARISGAAADTDATDHPRDAAGRALLGDPRDDENRLVASLHSIVARFHNLEVDRLRSQDPRTPAATVFATARRTVLWHYQYAALTDFLPAVVGRDMVSAVLPSIDVSRRAPSLRFYDACREAMPVEFSVAAYRFGHSMVRPLYRINSTVADRRPVFGPGPDFSETLAGFSPVPQGEAVDWDFLLPMNGTISTGHPQDAYKIDASLVFPLSLLPLPETDGGPTTLATRNLLRSMQLGLPSGQSVARAMGVTPLRDDQILVGAASGEEDDAEAITEVAPEFAGKAPLWTYVLAEAANRAFPISDGEITGPQRAPNRLGPVGGRIVAETFVGLLAADRSSVLYARGFRPDVAFSRNGRFGVRELIAAATGTDVARGRPVTVSPRQRRAGGGAAVDGDPDTALTLAGSGTHSVLVDLGSSTAVDKVRLLWAAAPSGSWSLAIGDRERSMTTVARSGPGGPAVFQAVGLPGRGRLVRLSVTGPARLAELAAYRPASLP